MFSSTAGLDSYNKTKPSAQGTLIQNWHEERVLREELGEGRTASKAHINKRHTKLFTKPVKELQNVYSQNSKTDQTFGRVFGRAHEPNFVSEHKDRYARRGTSNPAVQGKKYGLIERQFMDTINQELNYVNRNTEDGFNQRYMNTTYTNEFAKKNVGLNVVGRRVMRDQNGRSLAPDTRDEDLLVDHGFLKKAPLTDEKDLQAAVKKESYVTAQPYTFWAEKNNDGAFYKSKGGNEGAQFARNNDFLKTFSHYTHVKY